MASRKYTVSEADETGGGGTSSDLSESKSLSQQPNTDCHCELVITPTNPQVFYKLGCLP